MAEVKVPKLTGSHDCTTRIWNIDGGEVKQVFVGHTAE